MATETLYEQWEKRVRAEGEARAEARGEARILLRALVVIYETRFGAMSQVLRRTLAKVATPDMTELWVGLFVTASAKEIAAALRQGRPTN